MVTKTNKSKIQHKKSTPLREKMMDRLQSARFRYLNEELYTKDSSGAVKLFEEDPDAFTAYHEGYRQQVRKWPMNPLSKIIIAVKMMPVNAVVADFGCGDAELSKNVKQTVHSFDLIAANDRVTACDMAHVPLGKHTVDVAVFCLSLMGTNLQDYLIEANRVLKVGGTLLIAEVASRFDKVADFLTGVNRYGFTTIHTDFAHNLFYLMHFEKQRDVKNRKTLPILTLNPCIYKKR
ncbi:ribosomal RNA-processing protein 8 [Atheta coriaria]|uniref:ribosomal RNA-processing protein 8 n=1 Tax=Dalotia coriaria TaxID=877792 RepID=UPI0031F37C18